MKNAGTTGGSTEIGSRANVGNLTSKPSVFLRDSPGSTGPSLPDLEHVLHERTSSASTIAANVIIYNATEH